MSLSLSLKCKLFFLFFFLVTLELNASFVVLNETEKEWLKTHKTVRVGVGPDWAPFDFVDTDGKYKGIANDYLTLVSQKTGLHFEIAVDKWHHNLQKLKDKKIDMLNAVYFTAQRDKYMSYTKPYLEVLDYFYIRDDLNISSLADLDDKRVAIPRGYAHIDTIKKDFPQIKIVEVETFSESVDAVLENKADMLFDTQIALSYKLEQDGIRNIIPFKSYREHGLMKLYMSTYKGNDTLVSIVNKGIKSITKEEKQNVYQRWVSVSNKKGKSAVFSSKEKEWIKQHPVVTYSEVNWKPMSIIENNTMKGIINEYLQRITDESGLVFEFKKASSWPDVLQKFQDKKIDMVPGIGDSEFETQLGIASKTYVNFPFVLVTKNSKSFISSIDELDGKSIAVPKYWTSYNYLKENKPNINIIETKSVFEALDLVKNGKADAFLGHRAIAMYYVGTYYTNSLHLAGRVDYTFHHKILVQKSNTVLLGIINKVLQNISEKEHLEIKDKWLRVAVKEAQDYTLYYQIFFVLSLLIGVSLYHNRKLSVEIKERKEIAEALGESEQQVRKLLENIPLHVIVSNPQGMILSANPQALHDYQFALEDLSQLNILEFYENKEERENVLQTLKEQGKVEQKIVKFKRFDGVYSMMLSVLPIVYKQEKAFLSIGVDMSERLEIEKELVLAKENAELANKSKSEFLANMSHEIRTPMNAIVGFTELLSEQLNEPKLKSYVKTIQNASHSLLTLINDILDLSKIEAGKLEIHKKPTNIHKLINDIGTIFVMTLKAKGLHLVIDIEKNIPKSLYIDEVRLRQVILNLIGNAVKFTHEGYITLKVFAFNVDEHHSKLDLKISVTDTGIGIEKNQLTKIFAKFEQSEGQDNRTFGGTGLGLSISKHLCQMMDGEIGVESVYGEGSTFSINLYGIDISSIEEVSVEDVQTQTNNIIFEKATVLVVDDIFDNRELIIKTFQDTNIEIITAEDGVIAIEMYKKHHPSLVLMDIRMPNMDGYEAANILKSFSNVPILALTASVMKNEYDEKKSTNFDAYLRKPVLKAELYAELRKFLPFTQMKQEIEEETKISLSESALVNLESIIITLEEEIKELHTTAMRTNNMNDITLFGDALGMIAQEYDVALLETYVSDLKEAIDVFDIARMQRLLNDYGELVTVLSNYK